MSPDSKILEDKRQNYISEQLRRRAQGEPAARPTDAAPSDEQIGAWQRTIARHVAATPGAAARLEQIAVQARREIMGDGLTVHVLRAQLRAIGIDAAQV